MRKSFIPTLDCRRMWTFRHGAFESYIVHITGHQEGNFHLFVEVKPTEENFRNLLFLGSFKRRMDAEQYFFTRYHDLASRCNAPTLGP